MYYVIMPPASKPEFGTETFNRPFYDQAFFYQKGMECLKKSNVTFWDRIKRFRYLYFDAMFPMVGSCSFADQAIPFFSLLALGMTAVLLLLPFLFAVDGVSKSVVLLLIGVAFSQIVVLFFFNIEQRYLYGFFFTILLLSILIIYALLTHFKQARRWLVFYASLGILISLFLGFTKHEVVPIPETITMDVYQNTEHITNLYQKRDNNESKRYTIPTIDFIGSNQLVHRELGSYRYHQNVFIEFNTTIVVHVSGMYTFHVVSDDGFSLLLNHKKVMDFASDRPAEMDSTKLFLEEGTVPFSLYYFQGGGDMAIRAYYEINGTRYLIGEESSYLGFKRTQ